MKLKGINPFEQYVDKALFGIVGASLLGVLAWQFVGPGNQIEVGGQRVDPDKAFSPVATQAQAILAKVGSQTPELPAPPRADVLNRFEDHLTKGVSPGKNIVALAPRLSLGVGGAGDAGVGAESPIASLEVPAPGHVVAATFANAIDPMEVIANEELAKLLPAEQPFDKQAVSVEAVFDGTALAKALENDPEGDPRSIPLGWWRGQMCLVAIEMERERELSSGDWGEATIVPPMPGRAGLLRDLDKTVKSKADMPMLVSRAEQSQDLVMRPKYYNIIAGPEWAPPTEMSTGETKSEQMDRLQRRINDLEKEEATLKRRLDAKNKPATQTGGGRDEPAPSGGPGGRRGGGPPSPPTPSPESRGRDRSNQQTKRDPLEIKIEEVGTQITNAKADLEKLNAPPQAENQDSAKRLALLENAQSRVWTHDLTAEPGATYRYRVRAVTNNPLFDQKLIEAQKSDAQSPIVRGAWSDWTDPITVEAKEYYFITGASPADQLGGARASAEMYKFYYGFWRKAAAAVEPGDMLAAQAKLPDELRLWDMEKLKAGAKPKVSSNNNPAGDRDAPSGQRPRGRVNPEQEAAPAGEAADKAKPEDDGLSKPAPKTIDFVVDAMMLDTSALSTIGERGGKARFRTFLRDQVGRIVVRYPDADATSDLYKRLLANARLGENQGRPRVKPVDPQDLNNPANSPAGPGRRSPHTGEEESRPSGG
ncbi:MAG: hypothetical protein IT434_03565 [Phycisphaerales bacterium]|jgi:hypothetical protein|nr:hypothetical protein [Phycisphaerales bacterium]